jgi:hypothetical protein
MASSSSITASAAKRGARTDLRGSAEHLNQCGSRLRGA